MVNVNQPAAGRAILAEGMAEQVSTGLEIRNFPGRPREVQGKIQRRPSGNAAELELRVL